MPCCGYCGSKNHNIKECNQDNELVLLLEHKKCPDFFKMSAKILKKIASQKDIKTSLPRIQLAIKLSKLHSEIHSEKLYDENSCPICMEEFNDKQANTTITECGHKFCTTCFIIHTRRNNTCPCCRFALIKNQSQTERDHSPRNVNSIDTIIDNPNDLLVYQIGNIDINEVHDIPPLELSNVYQRVAYDPLEYLATPPPRLTPTTPPPIQRGRDMERRHINFEPTTPSISPPPRSHLNTPPYVPRSPSHSPQRNSRVITITPYVNEDGEESIDL